MARFWIDNGHGGKDSGATAYALKEKDINLHIGLKIKYHLERHHQIVGITRTNDKYIDLSARAKMANAFKADYFISTHENAGGGDGYDVIYSLSGGKSYELATKIAEEFNKLGQNKHGVFCRKGDNGKDYYCVIRETNMPAVIAEYAFIDNINDKQQIDEVKEWDAVAEAIAKACLKQIGVEWIPKNKEDEEVKLPYIVVYDNGINQRCAEYLADALNAPTISAERKFDYSVVDKVYCVGAETTNWTSYMTKLFSGKDRNETMRIVQQFINNKCE